MAQKKGRVSSVNKDGWAIVVTEKGDACNNCESAQLCHSLADCSRMETRVLNRANAGVGDRVIISRVLSANVSGLKKYFDSLRFAGQPLRSENWDGLSKLA